MPIAGVPRKWIASPRALKNELERMSMYSPAGPQFQTESLKCEQLPVPCMSN